MPPKSKKKPATKSDERSPIEKFIEELSGAIHKDGEIKLPQKTITELNGFLETLGKIEQIPHEDVRRVASTIDQPEDNRICRRLTAPLFSIILKLVTCGEECHEVTRCLYLLASSVYSSDLLPEEQSEHYKRLGQIGEGSLQLLLQHFADTQNDPRDRQWTGLLFKTLFDMDLDNNFFSLIFSPNAPSQIIGDNMMSETNAAVRFVGGQVIKTLIASGVFAQQLWSNAEEAVYTKFPDTQLPSSQFHKSFQTYVEDYVDPESDQYLGFAMGTSTNPQTSATIWMTSMIYINMNNLVVFIPARDASFDQCLEVPLEAMQNISMHESVQNRTAIPGATDLVIQIGQDSTKRSYLNSQPHDITELEFQFVSSEEAEELQDELCALRPEIEALQDTKSTKASCSKDTLEFKPPFVLTRDDSEPLGEAYMGNKNEVVKERIIRNTYASDDELDNPAYDFLSENSENPETYNTDEELPTHSQYLNEQSPSEPDLPKDLQYEADEGESSIIPEESTSDNNLQNATHNNSHMMENISYCSSSPMGADELGGSLHDKSSPSFRGELLKGKRVPTTDICSSTDASNPSGGSHKTSDITTERINKSPSSVEELERSPLYGKSSPPLRGELLQEKEISDTAIATTYKARTSNAQLRPKKNVARGNVALSKSKERNGHGTLQGFPSSASLTSPEAHDASTPKPHVSNMVAESEGAQHDEKKPTIPFKRPITATSVVSKSKKPKLYSLAPKPKAGSSSKTTKYVVDARHEFDFPSSDSQSATVSKPVTEKEPSGIKTGGRKIAAKPKPVVKPKPAPKPKAAGPKKVLPLRKPKPVSVPVALKPERSRRKAAERANVKIHDINSDEATVNKDGGIIQPRAKAKDAKNTKSIETTSPLEDIQTSQENRANEEAEISVPVSISDPPSPFVEHGAQVELSKKSLGAVTANNADIITKDVVADVEHPSASVEKLRKLQRTDAHELGLLDAGIDDFPEPQDRNQADLHKPVTTMELKKKSHRDMAATLNSMLGDLPGALSSPTTYRKSRVSPEAVQEHMKPVTDSGNSGLPPQDMSSHTKAKENQPMQETSNKSVEEPEIKILSDPVRYGKSDTTGRPKAASKKRKNVEDPLTPLKKQRLQAPSDDVLPSENMNKSTEKISTAKKAPDKPLGQKRPTLKAKSPQLSTRRSPRIQQKLDEIRTTTQEDQETSHQNLAVEQKSVTVEGKSLVDDVLSRKPAVVAFGSCGPRNQGRRLTIRKSLMNDPDMMDDDIKLLDIELPSTKPQNQRQSKIIVKSPKKHRKRENERIPKQLIVPFTEEDRIIIVSDGDDVDDDDLESEINFPRSKTPAVSENSKPQVSRVDENGSPKAFAAPAHKEYNRIVRGLFSAPLKVVQHSTVEALNSPNKNQTVHGAPQRATTNTSILSSKHKPADSSQVRHSENPLPVRVTNRRIEQPFVIANKSKNVPVSDINDPFTDESVLRSPTLLTKKFQDLSVPISKTTRLMSRQKVLGQRSRFSDEDQTLIERREIFPYNSAEQSSDSEEDTKVDHLQEVELDEWQNALKPHYKPVLDTLTRINKELIMRMSREEEAIAMVVEEYQENGLKLITPLIEEENKRQEGVKSTVREAATKLGGMLEDLRTNAHNVLINIEENSASEFRKEMEARHKAQQEMMERLMGGK